MVVHQLQNGDDCVVLQTTAYNNNMVNYLAMSERYMISQSDVDALAVWIDWENLCRCVNHLTRGITALSCGAIGKLHHDISVPALNYLTLNTRYRVKDCTVAKWQSSQCMVTFSCVRALWQLEFYICFWILNTKSSICQRCYQAKDCAVEWSGTTFASFGQEWTFLKVSQGIVRLGKEFNLGLLYHEESLAKFCFALDCTLVMPLIHTFLKTIVQATRVWSVFIGS